MNCDGTLKIDWVKDGDNWKFYSGNKIMLTGWWDIGNKRYYFTKDGLMASSKWPDLMASGITSTPTAFSQKYHADGYKVDSDGIRKNK